MNEYEKFLQGKKRTATSSGFEYAKEKMCEKLFEWQKDIVFWSLKKGVLPFLRIAVLERRLCSSNGQRPSLKPKNARFLLSVLLRLQNRQKGKRRNSDLKMSASSET